MTKNSDKNILENVLKVTKESVKESSKWFKDAKDDAMCSKKLYEIKQFPKALYHLHQSVEKFNKAHSILLNIDYNKVHDLRSIIYKYLLAVMEESIKEYNLNISQTKEIHTNLKKLNKKSHNDDIWEKSIKLNLLFRKYFISQKQKLMELKNDFKKLKISELDTKTAIALFEKSRSEVENILKLIKENNDAELNKSKEIFSELISKVCIYSFMVSLYLSFILPKDPQKLRYPTYNPLEKYNENHNLIINFNKIGYHQYHACRLMYSWTSVEHN